MAIQSKKENKEEAAAVTAVKVTRVKDFTKPGAKTCISFDMEANGIQIYGCWYRIAVNKQGEEFAAISFPSHQGADKKYYNYAYFKISSELLSDIEKQIEAML